MAEKTIVDKGVHKQTKIRLLIGLTAITSSVIAIGASAGIAYVLAESRNNDYSKITSQLEKYAKEVDGVSFRSSKLSPFSNFDELKNEWNENKTLDKAKDFFVLRKFVDGQFINFDLPSSYYVTFSNVKPNDKTQSFDIEFYITTTINGQTFYSKKRSTTVPINIESTFFLNNFSSATKILFSSALRPYDAPSSEHKLAKITLASDFFSDVNKATTSEEAIEKINDYFNIKELISNLLNDSNFFVKLNNKTIKPYSISLQPIFKNEDGVKWIVRSTTAEDTFEANIKLSFTDQAKNEFPKSFNTDLTNKISFEITNSKTKKSPFISEENFLAQVTIESPAAKNYYFSNEEQKLTGLQTTADESVESKNPSNPSTTIKTKKDISNESLINVYRELKFKNNQLLNTSDESKIILNSFLKTNLPFNFNELKDISDEVRNRFSYQIDVSNIVLGGDDISTYISVPLKILYKSPSSELSKNTTILLRQYKPVEGKPGSYQIKDGAPVVPYIANISNVVDLKNSDKSVAQTSEKEFLKSHQLISYEEIEKLVKDKSYNKLINVLKDPSQFDYTFIEQPFLNAWISKYKLANIDDFKTQTLLPTHIKNNEYTKLFFDSNFAFGQFTNKILQLSEEDRLPYLTYLFNSLNQDYKDKSNSTKESQQTHVVEAKSAVISAPPTEHNLNNGGNLVPENEHDNTHSSTVSKQAGEQKVEKTQKSNELILESLKLVKKTFVIDLLDKLIQAISEKKDSPLDASSFAQLFASTYKDDKDIQDYDNFARSLRYNIKFDDATDSLQTPGKETQPNTPSSQSQSQQVQNSSESTPTNEKNLKLTYHYEFYEADKPDNIVFKTTEQELNLMVSSLTIEQVSDMSLARQVVNNLPANLHQLVLKNKTLADFKSKFNGTKMSHLDTAQAFQQYFGYKKFMEIQPLLKGLALFYEPNNVSTNFSGETTVKFFLTRIPKEDEDKIVDNYENNPIVSQSSTSPSSPVVQPGVVNSGAGHSGAAAPVSKPEEDKQIGSSIIVFTVSEAKENQ